MGQQVNACSCGGNGAPINNMTDVRTTDKVCVEVLSEALSTPITTSKQSYYILERLALCFVSVARDVSALSKEVYGNGVPGGLKAQVQALAQSQIEIKIQQEYILKKIDMLREELTNERIKRASREEEILKKTVDDRHDLEEMNKDRKDTFDGIVKWFADKVLPSLVIFTLTTLGIGFAILVAMSSGLVTVTFP